MSESRSLIQAPGVLLIVAWANIGRQCPVLKGEHLSYLRTNRAVAQRVGEEIAGKGKGLVRPDCRIFFEMGLLPEKGLTLVNQPGNELMETWDCIGRFSKHPITHEDLQALCFNDDLAKSVGGAIWQRNSDLLLLSQANKQIETDWNGLTSDFCSKLRADVGKGHCSLEMTDLVPCTNDDLFSPCPFHSGRQQVRGTHRLVYLPGVSVASVMRFLQEQPLYARNVQIAAKLQGIEAPDEGRCIQGLCRYSPSRGPRWAMVLPEGMPAAERTDSMAAAIFKEQGDRPIRYDLMPVLDALMVITMARIASDDFYLSQAVQCLPDLRWRDSGVAGITISLPKGSTTIEVVFHGRKSAFLWQGCNWLVERSPRSIAQWNELNP